MIFRTVLLPTEQRQNILWEDVTAIMPIGTHLQRIIKTGLTGRSVSIFTTDSSALLLSPGSMFFVSAGGYDAPSASSRHWRGRDDSELNVQIQSTRFHFKPLVKKLIEKSVAKSNNRYRQQEPNC